MIHIIFGVMVLVMAAFSMYNPQQFYIFNYILLNISMLGGMISIWNGLSKD